MSWIQQVGSLHRLIADGVTAEGRVVVTKSVLEIVTNDHIDTIAVNAGGTGYAVGEEFDIDGGTPLAVNGRSFFARGRVTAESGGVVTGVQLLSAGAYSADPTLSGETTSNATAGGNDDLTIDITMQTAYWTLDEENYTDLTTLNDWLCSSVKAANEPTVGMRARLSGANDGIQMQCATSYDSGASWLAQPGAAPSNLFYCAVPNTNPEIYISTTERRINVLIHDGTNIQYLSLGLFIPFTDVDGNYPFPGIVAAQSSSVLAINTGFTSTNRGVCHPIDFGALGCYQYRNNLSTEWYGISEDNQNGVDVCRAQIWPSQGTPAEWEFNDAPLPTNSNASASDYNPSGSSSEAGSFEEDQWYHSEAGTNEEAQGPAPLGEGSQLHFTTQVHIVSNQPNDTQFIGIVDGFEALHGRGLTVFDEIVTEAGIRYLVFDDTNSGNTYRWVAMEKL